MAFVVNTHIAKQFVYFSPFDFRLGVSSFEIVENIEMFFWGEQLE